MILWKINDPRSYGSTAITVHLLVLLCFLHVFAVCLDQLLAALRRDGNQPQIVGILRLDAVLHLEAVLVKKERNVPLTLAQVVMDLAVVTAVVYRFLVSFGFIPPPQERLLDVPLVQGKRDVLLAVEGQFQKFVAEHLLAQWGQAPLRPFVTFLVENLVVWIKMLTFVPLIQI